MIVNPCSSFNPFDYDILHSTLLERMSWLKDVARLEGGYIKATIWMLHKRMYVLRHKEKIKENFCHK